ncbi:MAG: aminotransferase class IV [Flavobacteriaceae bacterium]|nr:aminotransferase class IV [Mangrovimonas sp.]MCB0436091.1 aminotransferase class IV [Mangrovimonas sp.]
MVNYNGQLTKNTVVLSITNRGFAFGDAVFETIKTVNSKPLFWEDHYFRLMASMRILRMEIPMEFTMEFLESEILKTIKANSLENSAVRVKLTVFREGDGLYTPKTNNIAYVITVKETETSLYQLNINPYRVDIFKDYPLAPGLLSTLKTNNRVVNVVGGIYADENDLDNCILLNTNKQVVEALNGNVFLVLGKTIKTPPILDGCIKGVLRKQLIDIIKASTEFTLEESSVSPFELQRADELFITNVITGIQPVTTYRKKAFATTVAESLLRELNKKAEI